MVEVKVTRNYQITIPAEYRARLEIRVGDVLVVTYDESEGVLKIRRKVAELPRFKLGKRIDAEYVERVVEEEVLGGGD